MKNFKKALALVLVVALSVGAGIMGTIAYLQDEDSDVNVMTLGNVSIKQHEYQRVENADGTFATDTIDGQNSYVLEDFVQGKPLLPSAVVVSSTPWDSTTVRMSQVGSYGGMQTFLPVTNAQDKFVVVENDGITDAYIRTIVAIEVGSADPELISFSNHFTWIDNQHGVVTIDGNNYFIHEFTYAGAPGVRHEGGILPAGDTAYPSLSQVYIKPEATNEDMVKIDGNRNGTLDILVLSQAVQTAGFADADTALDAAFGDVDAANVAAWFGDENIPVIVSSANELKAALEAGETDIVVKGAEITENFFNGRYYKDRNIDFIDCTFTANMNYMYINDATFTNCTFDCGAANSAVHYDELFGDLVFNNCTFKSGKIQIGANKDMTGTVTFNDCVFEQTDSTSIWAEKGIRVYSPAEFNNCEFNNRVVLAGANGLSITFNTCTMNGGCPVYYVDNTDGIIRGGNIPVVTINSDIAYVNVDNAADMYAALEAGETDIVVKGATIDSNSFNGHYYKDRNVHFVGCTFTANMNYMYINNATFTNCTFDCGSANAAVHYDELFGDLVFNNCTFVSGKIQIGANADVTGTVTFNNCEFADTASTSIWSDNGVRVYSPATFNGCEFNNRVVLAGANGLSITFDSCTMNGGTPVYYVDNTDGIIRGGNIPVVTIQ